MSTGPGGFQWARDDWRDKANCAGASLDAFFPVAAVATREQCNAALALCDACEVTPECLAYALRSKSAGVWGGLTEFEREVILRRERASEREVAEVAS